MKPIDNAKPNSKRTTGAGIKKNRPRKNPKKIQTMIPHGNDSTGTIERV